MKRLIKKKSTFFGFLRRMDIKRMTLRISFKNLFEIPRRNQRNKNVKDGSLTMVLPFIQCVNDKIVGILKKKDIKTSFKPPSIIRSLKKLVKDLIDSSNSRMSMKLPVPVDNPILERQKDFLNKGS